MFTVFTRSEEYGEDTFSYDTLEEAMAAIARLHRAAKLADDGVGRDIGIRLYAKEETSEGWVDLPDAELNDVANAYLGRK